MKKCALILLCLFLLVSAVSATDPLMVIEAQVYGLSPTRGMRDRNGNGSWADDMDRYLRMYGFPGVCFRITEIMTSSDLLNFGMDMGEVDAEHALVVGIYTRSSNGKPVNFEMDSSQLFSISLATGVNTRGKTKKEFLSRDYDETAKAVFVKYPMGIVEDDYLIGYFLLTWTDEDVEGKQANIKVDTV